MTTCHANPEAKDYDPVELALQYGLAGYDGAAQQPQEDNPAVALARAYGLEGISPATTPQTAEDLNPTVSLARAYGLKGVTPTPTQSGASSLAASPAPVPSDALELARTALTVTGSVEGARLTLTRRALTDKAFRDSLAPSQTKGRRGESIVSTEHRDAIFRAVDAASKSE